MTEIYLHCTMRVFTYRCQPREHLHRIGALGLSQARARSSEVAPVEVLAGERGAGRTLVDHIVQAALALLLRARVFERCAHTSAVLENPCMTEIYLQELMFVCAHGGRYVWKRTRSSGAVDTVVRLRVLVPFAVVATRDVKVDVDELIVAREIRVDAIECEHGIHRHRCVGPSVVVRSVGRHPAVVDVRCFHTIRNLETMHD